MRQGGAQPRAKSARGGNTMKGSPDRILTTFVGSVARPPDLIQTMTAKESGRPYDSQTFDAQIRSAVNDVVRRQAEAGVDVVSDGEQGKPGFVTYIGERLTGFESRPAPPRAGPWVGSREIADFPEYYAWYSRWRGESVSSTSGLYCTGPVTYKGYEALKRDIENFKAALSGVKIEEAFLDRKSVV